MLKFLSCQSLSCMHNLLLIRNVHKCILCMHGNLKYRRKKTWARSLTFWNLQPKTGNVLCSSIRTATAFPSFTCIPCKCCSATSHLNIERYQRYSSLRQTKCTSRQFLSCNNFIPSQLIMPTFPQSCEKSSSGYFVSQLAYKTETVSFPLVSFACCEVRCIYTKLKLVHGLHGRIAMFVSYLISRTTAVLCQV